jgi:putative transposase
MPRRPRLVLPGIPHHITQRGNYRQKTYFRAEDYRLYLELLKDYSRHHGVAILGYCLMPNHVHLVAVPQRPDSFARTANGTGR